MSVIEKKLEAMGLVLPAPMQLPPGVVLPFPWVRVHGSRVFVSGHGPQEANGAVCALRGKVGHDVTLEEARHLATRAGLSMLASLKRTLGELDRVTAWLRVFGMVNSAPGFTQQPDVINGFTELIIGLWGEAAGKHSRSAVGMAELPFGIPVEIEAEVEIDGGSKAS
jgi:enamine deaminase RidA (YjgF/YER057c/UK114 family)